MKHKGIGYRRKESKAGDLVSNRNQRADGEDLPGIKDSHQKTKSRRSKLTIGFFLKKRNHRSLHQIDRVIRELGQPRSSETHPHRRTIFNYGSEFRPSSLRFGRCLVRRRSSIGFVPYRYADRGSSSELCDCHMNLRLLKLNAQILAEILGFNMTGTKVVRRALRKKLRLDRDRRRDWVKLKPRLNGSGGL
ncbi:hypothetical protein LXL04_038473 [Taraxacum kok-saghyz]